MSQISRALASLFGGTSSEAETNPEIPVGGYPFGFPLKPQRRTELFRGPVPLQRPVSALSLRCTSPSCAGMPWGLGSSSRRTCTPRSCAFDSICETAGRLEQNFWTPKWSSRGFPFGLPLVILWLFPSSFRLCPSLKTRHPYRGLSIIWPVSEPLAPDVCGRAPATRSIPAFGSCRVWQ